MWKTLPCTTSSAIRRPLSQGAVNTEVPSKQFPHPPSNSLLRVTPEPVHEASTPAEREHPRSSLRTSLSEEGSDGTTVVPNRAGSGAADRSARGRPSRRTAEPHAREARRTAGTLDVRRVDPVAVARLERRHDEF